MTPESGHDEAVTADLTPAPFGSEFLTLDEPIGAAEQSADAAAASPESPAADAATPPALAQEEQQLAQQDPQLIAELQQQELAAEQAIAADPSQASTIEQQFDQQAVTEIAQVDPQLAQELASQITPATPTPTETTVAQPSEPVTIPSPQVLQQEEQQLAQQDPQLVQEIQQQAAAANQQATQDPQQAAQIMAQSEQQQLAELAQVDPKLAAELSAQLQASDLTFNAQGEPEQGPAPSNQTIGDPNQDASQWSWQGANGYCGPNSISMMLEAASGQHLSEQQVEQWAAQHGEMSPLPAAGDPAGSPSIHVGMEPQQAAEALNQLGQQYGVTAELKYGNMTDLEGYLGQGREVMICVDADALWHEPGVTDTGQPDHFVVVTGFDPSTDTVYINDPGVPYGREEAVPLSEFEKAWEASNDVMIVTQTAGHADQNQSAGAEAQPGPVLLPITLDGGLVRRVSQ